MLEPASAGGADKVHPDSRRSMLLTRNGWNIKMWLANNAFAGQFTARLYTAGSNTLGGLVDLVTEV